MSTETKFETKTGQELYDMAIYANKNKRMEFLQRAVELNHPNATHELAKTYAKGYNYAKTKELYLKAYDLGCDLSNDPYIYRNTYLLQAYMEHRLKRMEDKIRYLSGEQDTEEGPDWT